LIAILDDMSSGYSPDGGVEHSVLYIEIDDCLKDYLNTYGLNPFDHALIEMSTLIAQELPSDHHLGRIGGVSFLVILPNTGLAAATTVAEHLRITIEARPLASCPIPVTVTLTVTIGVATTPLNTSWSSDDLIALADARVFVGTHCLTPRGNRVWAGDLPSDGERQWEADWSIDWHRKWGTHWPSADPIVSKRSQQEPTSSSHVEYPHLTIGDVVLRFQSANRKERLVVTLDHGKNTVILGEIDSCWFLTELNQLFTDGRDYIADRLEYVGVYDVAFFRYGYYRMSAKKDGWKYCVCFKDNDRNTLATVRINKKSAARALADISALDRAIKGEIPIQSPPAKGESHLQMPPVSFLARIEAKLLDFYRGKKAPKH
jgi:diguanylate cyclase (GGDEF)-like protein